MIPAEAVEAAAFMAGLRNGFASAVNYEAKIEDMLAKARVLSVPEEQVREFIAAEHNRAVSSTKPFSWDTISEQISGAAL